MAIQSSSERAACPRRAILQTGRQAIGSFYVRALLEAEILGLWHAVETMHFHRATSLVLLLALPFATPVVAQEPVPERVPLGHWLRFADSTQAGFDTERLEAARKVWEGLPSSAFLVIADGAVVVDWGDTDRRFMCHSVRKSFLSALYGIYWDRGELELNKTLADLGMDDEPSPLLATEKTARILDLLKARSGVFHPAAYAGRTDSRPRGSEGPGRYFAYNNWDFNTLATILEMETGDRVFEAFDQHLGKPLGMQDWRVSDGYYHYERDKSKYPAYPFRLSARDAARFGLLFAREGMWGDEQILSRHWVKRSSALYSIDSEIMGYGFMWWVFLQPRFEKHGMYSALGVGNQMIAALPDSDIVIVNRANTYAGEGTPMGPLLNLIEQILDARTGDVAPDPKLLALEETPDPRVTNVSAEKLQEFVGEWPFPPPVFGQSTQATVEFTMEPGHLVMTTDFAGTFRLYLQPDGSLHEEDSFDDYLIVRDAEGRFVGPCDATYVVNRALEAVAEEDFERAAEILALAEGDQVPALFVGREVLNFLIDDPDAAEDSLRTFAKRSDQVAFQVDRIAQRLQASKNDYLAEAIAELQVRLFPAPGETGVREASSNR